jgi:hypothetical protein
MSKRKPSKSPSKDAGVASQQKAARFELSAPQLAISAVADGAARRMTRSSLAVELAAVTAADAEAETHMAALRRAALSGSLSANSVASIDQLGRDLQLFTRLSVELPGVFLGGAHGTIEVSCSKQRAKSLQLNTLFRIEDTTSIQLVRSDTGKRLEVYFSREVDTLADHGGLDTTPTLAIYVAPDAQGTEHHVLWKTRCMGMGSHISSYVRPMESVRAYCLLRQFLFGDPGVSDLGHVTNVALRNAFMKCGVFPDTEAAALVKSEEHTSISSDAACGLLIWNANPTNPHSLPKPIVDLITHLIEHRLKPRKRPSSQHR